MNGHLKCSSNRTEYLFWVVWSPSVHVSSIFFVRYIVEPKLPIRQTWRNEKVQTVQKNNTLAPEIPFRLPSVLPRVDFTVSVANEELNWLANFSTLSPLSVSFYKTVPNVWINGCSLLPLTFSHYYTSSAYILSPYIPCDRYVLARPLSAPSSLTDLPINGIYGNRLRAK